MQPIDFIESLNQTDPIIKTIFMNGGCYQFYEFLKKIYPNAKPYINLEKNHVATKIDKDFYDIEGYAIGIFEPLIDECEIEMCKKWSFSKYRFISKECPNCEEPIELTTGGKQ